MTYAGFDRCDMPPLDMMARLKAETNLTWCGFYLAAPSQPGTTWRGKRAQLVAQGWGLAPIYVGQQMTDPGSHVVTAGQGRIDGADACAKLRAEGFPGGSWVYLDIEKGPPFLSQERAYVQAWVNGVESGGFRAGVYCSFLFAAEVHALCSTARIWVYHVSTTTPHPVHGLTFIAPHPKDSGYPGADLWQRDDSAVLTSFGNLLVDLDIASMPDPGAPDGPAPSVTLAPTGLAASIQAALNARGYHLYVDGDLGPASQGAIADFIAKHPT